MNRDDVSLGWRGHHEKSKKAIGNRGMRAVFTLYLVGISALISGLAQFFYNPILPQVQEELHTSMYWVNMTVTVYTVAMAAMQLVFGAVADRKGRRSALLAGMLLFVGASFGAAYATNVAALLVFRAIQGMGAAAIPVVAAAVISDLFQGSERTKAMGTYQFILALSPAIGPMIGGILGARFGHYGVFLFLAFVSAAAWFANLLWLKESRPAHSMPLKMNMGSFRLFLLNGKCAAVMVIDMTQALASTVVLVFIPTIFHDYFSLRPETTGVSFLLMSLTFMVFTKLSAAMANAWGIEKSFILGCWFNVLSLILFAVFVKVSVLAAFVLFCFFGASYGIAMPPPLSILAEMFREERATAIAMYNLCRFIGMALGPMIGSLLFLTHSAMLLFGMIAVIYGGGTALCQYLLMNTSRCARDY
ncbi:MFS transporter [Paenibacillus hamazuiensis]|uniref:MFS transporter n=1 Tax=Paenibacillus hamazuiensis TaxID=2936508 RepID=UPI00200DF8A2|nr:MFS transporter [Paenibacillus hamazuiensis]